MSKCFSTWIFLFSLFSCNHNNVPEKVRIALVASGNNRGELDKVISHYQKTEDSLKLKAAYFLIGNMLGKSYNTYTSAQAEFIELLKSSQDLSSDSIKVVWSSMKTTHERPKQHYDLEELSSEYLIANIEEAFRAWDKRPWSGDYSFDDFCDYVLPYRNFYDIPESWRQKMRDAFSSVPDSLGVIETCSLINQQIDSIQFTDIFYEWPNMSVSDISEIRRATCLQYNSLKIYAARSLGVPVMDVTPLNSTSYAGILNADRSITEWRWDKSPWRTDTVSRLWSPKIFASTYRIQEYPFSNLAKNHTPPLFRMNIIDVTDIGYRPIDVKVHLTIENPPQCDFSFASVFNYQVEKWEAAEWSIIKAQQASFNRLGSRNIYLPTYYLDDISLPAGYPFFLREDGTVKELKPNFDTIQAVKVFRKYPLGDKEKKFAQAFRGAVIEGSNKRDFRYPTLLHKISKTPQTHDLIDLDLEHGKFRYLRIRSNEVLGLSSFEFFGLNGDRLNGQPIISEKEDTQKNQLANLFDGDIRTHFTLDRPGWIGVDFSIPRQVGQISYMFRNSFNTVEKGHLYELMFWDNKWLSLGTRIARSGHVEFDAPKNALLLLKDHTSGVQELPFFMDGSKQIWALSWGNELGN